MFAITNKGHNICFDSAKPLAAESAQHTLGYLGKQHPQVRLWCCWNSGFIPFSPSELQMQKVESVISLRLGHYNKTPLLFSYFLLSPTPTPILFPLGQHSKVFIFLFIFVILKHVVSF